jgi:Asp-tRNA(Asn)/Glu-tRNA(Gln) amidotransferase A subunit family amidase
MLDILRTPLDSLVKLLSSGEVELESYLSEVERSYKKLEPSLLAFIPEDNRFERLRKEAKELQDRYPHPENRPALFGVPIGIKDIFHVTGFETRAGSDLPPEELAGYEASSVKRLREAGALIMGKTVTTEFAYFAPGPSRNPHNLEHTPGGSSSGSAAAVAAKLCPIATGTQTIGSVIRPAAFCGVVGYKPTYDRVPRDGVIPLSPSLDHVGLFSQNARSMWLAASVLCPEWQEVTTSRRPVLGIIQGAYMEHASAEGLEQFWDVCGRLEEAGYKILRVKALSHMTELVKCHFLILAAEAAQVHAYWFAKFEDRYHKRTAHLINQGNQMSIAELTTALNSRQALRSHFSQLMTGESIDLWISPAAPGVAPKGLHNTGDPVMNLPWTHCGFPSLTLPSGKNHQGLPYGLQLVGKWDSDEQLLSWSLQIEALLSSNVQR